MTKPFFSITAGLLSLWISPGTAELSDVVSVEIKRLGTDYAGVYQKEAKQTLQRLGPAAFPHLIGSLRDSDPYRRMNVMEVLGELGDKRSIPHLLKVFEQASSTVIRCKALEALGKMRDMSLFNFIVKQIESSDPHLHCYAIWAAGELRSRKVLPYIVPILNSERGYPVITAIDALGKSGGPEEALRLLEFLKYDNMETRFVTAKALEHIGDARIAPALFEALTQESHIEVQEALAKTLGKTGGEGSIAKLVGWIRDETSFSRQRLGEIGLQAAGLQASFHLMPLLRADDLKSRIAAAKVLGAIRAPGAIQPLLDMLANDNKTAQIVAISALGECGDASTLEPLNKAARSRDASFREAAEAAIKKITSRTQAVATTSLEQS